MKIMALIVGDDLKFNQNMIEYINQTCKKHFMQNISIKFISSNDNDLLFVVEDLIKNLDSLCIFASNENYDIMAKILATLSLDTLESTDNNTLIPKKSKKSAKGSFLIELNGVDINLILANPCEGISEILVKNEVEFEIFHIIDMDKESVKILLEPLAKPYKVQIVLSEILSNLVLVRVSALQFGSIPGFIQSVENLFAKKVILSDDIIKFIADKFIEKGLKITFAESCTAGLCASSLAKFSGISEIFEGSLVCYSNRIKNEWLGVDKGLLESYGAVSEQCVQAMLSGALRSSEADFSIAISGIAGPGGSTSSKPVGTIFIGALHKDGTIITERLNLKGDRNYIRQQSVLAAFVALLKLKANEFL